MACLYPRGVYIGAMRYVLCILALLAASPAAARPVAFPGAWMPMLEVDGSGFAAEAGYSPSARYALGLRSEYMHADDAWLHMATYNRLLWRDNQPSAQANLYVRSGLGAAHAKRDDALAGFLGLTADWEDRDYMVSYENNYLMTGLSNVDDRFEQRARLGIAPYRATYEEWQPWLILQLDHRPGSDTAWEATPLLRVFNGGPVLAEFGVSNHGNIYSSIILTF